MIIIISKLYRQPYKVINSCQTANSMQAIMIQMERKGIHIKASKESINEFDILKKSSFNHTQN